MYYPKYVSRDDNESDDLMTWPDNQDLDSTNIVTADQGGEIKWTDVDADVTSKGEKGVIEMEDDLPTPPQVQVPVPSVTQSGWVSHLPQYILDNYQYIGETGNMEFEIKLTPIVEANQDHNNFQKDTW
eukprot:11602337-Ditylum_brightwellii.AAC.1